MYGFLLPDENQTGRHAVLSQEMLCGLSVLQVRIPMKGRLSEKRLERRVTQAAEQLRKNGVRRVIHSKGFLWRETLARSGLTEVKTTELYRAAAAPLALEALELRGWKAERAIVALAGERVSGPLFRTAEALARKVGGLCISVPDGGMGLTEYLREEYGLPAVPDTVRPALTVAFDESWQGRGAALQLWGEKPELLGVEVYVPELELPENCESLSLLAALWESGLLPQNRLCARVRRNDP